MRQPIFVSNSPIDEKRISFIERTVSKLARRSVSVAKAYLSPYPISGCVAGEDVKGDVLKYMFASGGKIAKGKIVIVDTLKQGVTVTIRIESNKTGTTKSYLIEKKEITVEPDILVNSGDRLTISLNPTSVEDKITEVWMCFLWVPKVKDADIKQFLIDELESQDDTEEQ